MKVELPHGQVDTPISVGHMTSLHCQCTDIGTYSMFPRSKIWQSNRIFSILLSIDYTAFSDK